MNLTVPLHRRWRDLVPQSARTGLKARLHLLRHPGAPIFVHIGKCGGSTLLEALRQSDDLGRFFYVHMVPPPLLPGARYILAVRNPLSRFVSAFNHHLASFRAGRPERGDPAAIAELFTRFGDVGQLAGRLMGRDGPDPELADLVARIGHLHRGLDFYLGALLRSPAASGIGPVFVQETLTEDIRRLIGSDPPASRRRVSGEGWRASLEARPAANLSRFLAADFAVIERLRQIGLVEGERAHLLLDRPDGAGQG